MRKINKSTSAAQSMLEYALLICIVVGVFWGMRIYAIRALGGYWRNTADTFGFSKQFCEGDQCGWGTNQTYKVCGGLSGTKCVVMYGIGTSTCSTDSDCITPAATAPDCVRHGLACDPKLDNCCGNEACVIPPCFTSGTLILTPKGKTPIEKLAQGDEVFSVDMSTYKMVPKKVVVVHQHVTDKILQIGLSNGTSVQVTPEHPFFDPQKGRYRPIGSFRVGDKVVLVSKGDKFKTEEVKIVSKKMLREKNTPVYNITVEKPFENYIAEGIIVHNKPPGGFCGGPPPVTTSPPCAGENESCMGMQCCSPYTCNGAGMTCVGSCSTNFCYACNENGCNGPRCCSDRECVGAYCVLSSDCTTYTCSNGSPCRCCYFGGDLILDTCSTCGGGSCKR